MCEHLFFQNLDFRDPQLFRDEKKLTSTVGKETEKNANVTNIIRKLTLFISSLVLFLRTQQHKAFYLYGRIFDFELLRVGSLFIYPLPHK